MSYQGVPESFSDEQEQLRSIGRVLNGILLGQINNVSLLTLSPDEESTILAREEIGKATVVFLSPMTQSAAQALASGVVWATCESGALTIHHDLNSATDRILSVAYFG